MRYKGIQTAKKERFSFLNLLKYINSGNKHPKAWPDAENYAPNYLTSPTPNFNATILIPSVKFCCMGYSVKTVVRD